MDIVEFSINQTREIRVLGELLVNYDKLYKKTPDPKLKRYIKYSSYLVVGKLNRMLGGLPKLDDKVKNYLEDEFENIFEE